MPNHCSYLEMFYIICIVPYFGCCVYIVDISAYFLKQIQHLYLSPIFFKKFCFFHEIFWRKFIIIFFPALWFASFEVDPSAATKFYDQKISIVSIKDSKRLSKWTINVCLYLKRFFFRLYSDLRDYVKFKGSLWSHKLF